MKWEFEVKNCFFGWNFSNLSRGLSMIYVGKEGCVFIYYAVLYCVLRVLVLDIILFKFI